MAVTTIQDSPQARASPRKLGLAITPEARYTEALGWTIQSRLRTSNVPGQTKCRIATPATTANDARKATWQGYRALPGNTASPMANTDRMMKTWSYWLTARSGSVPPNSLTPRKSWNAVTARNASEHQRAGRTDRGTWTRPISTNEVGRMPSRFGEEKNRTVRRKPLRVIEREHRQQGEIAELRPEREHDGDHDVRGHCQSRNTADPRDEPRKERKEADGDLPPDAQLEFGRRGCDRLWLWTHRGVGSRRPWGQHGQRGVSAASVAIGHISRGLMTSDGV